MTITEFEFHWCFTSSAAKILLTGTGNLQTIWRGSMVLGEWTKDDEGKVEVFPLVAFETLVAHAALCGLRIHYLEQQDQLASGQTSSVQLIMTPDMARSIAKALIASANDAELGHGGPSCH